MPRRLSTVRGREFGEGLRAAVQRSTLNGREILFLEDEKQIKGYEAVLKALDRVALDEEQSRELITAIATLGGSRMGDWHKSSYSAGQSACVEVGRGVGIRDSKTTGHLPLTPPTWTTFLTAAKSGALDHPACG